MCIFKYISVLFLFLVVTTNTYSQKKNDNLRDSVYHYVFLRDTLLSKKTDYYRSTISTIAFFCNDINPSNEYFVLFFDGKYINHGILRENDGELFTKYSPNKECDDSTCFILETESEEKIYHWIAQELKKGAIVSVNNANKKGTYICKSFIE